MIITARGEATQQIETSLVRGLAAWIAREVDRAGAARASILCNSFLFGHAKIHCANYAAPVTIS
ncbi:hypothetical protein AB7M17_006255 [Bradyrhizobium sp. USDA 377]